MWMAKLQALKSFESVTEGEIFYAVLDERWAHLVANDYVRLVDKWPLVTQFALTDSKYKLSPLKLVDD